MTTFQDPQPQSRRAVRQSERGEAAEQPAQPSFGQQPPAAPQHFAQPESSRDMWDTTARRAAQLPPASTRPEGAGNSGRRSATPAVPLAEPLTYSTQSKTPAPSYDAQTFRTRADTSTTSEQFKVRDFSPEGRRSAHTPDRSWSSPTPTPADPSSDLDYHTEARESEAAEAPVAETPVAEALVAEVPVAEVPVFSEPAPTVAFTLPESEEPAEADQPEQAEPEAAPESVIAVEEPVEPAAPAPAAVEQARPVERTVTRRQLRAMQQAEEASLNSQVPELVQPPMQPSVPITSLPPVGNIVTPAVPAAAPPVVESSPFEALFRRTPATDAAPPAPIDFPPAPRGASVPVEPVVVAPTSDPVPDETLAKAISEFDNLTTSQQASSDQARSTEPGTWTPPAGHWSTQADLDDDFADNAVNRRIGSGHTATNALVLPSIPLGADIRGPLTGTGEIVLTGSIDLPQTLASTGQSDRFDSGIDDLFDLSDAEITSTDSSPVRAIRAVSTHNSGHGVTHTQKPKGTKALTVLLIAASSMAVVVAGLLVAAFAFNVF